MRNGRECTVCVRDTGKGSEEGKECESITERNGRKGEGGKARDGGMVLRSGKRREDYEGKSRPGEKIKCMWIKDGITHLLRWNEGGNEEEYKMIREREEKGKRRVEKEDRRRKGREIRKQGKMRNWE